MNYSTAQDLVTRLRRACPVRSGALRMSISKAQGNAKEYVITIGNNQGKEINGCCATVEYAAITNFAQRLSNGARNKNYHWVNKCVKLWIQNRQLDFVIREDEKQHDNV